MRLVAAQDLFCFVHETRHCGCVCLVLFVMCSWNGSLLFAMRRMNEVEDFKFKVGYGSGRLRGVGIGVYIAGWHAIRSVVREAGQSRPLNMSGK